MRIRNLGLGGLIGVALTTVLVHPHTQWVSRLQLGRVKTEAHLRQKVAEKNPQSFPFQFALALNKDYDSASAVRNLRELEARFPEEPVLRAAILRFSTAGPVRPLHYADEDLASAKRGSKPRTEPKLYAPTLAAYDSDAVVGERLDPNNAYFPLMRAVGLYGAGKDAEARAALHRAAQKPRYDDYVRYEAEAQWALSAAAYGNTGTVAQAAQSATILFPHYVQLRSVALIALGQAMRAEQQGDATTGLALRQDLRKVGSLMRHDATTVIGNLVGIAISRISGGQPGGERVLGLPYEAYCAGVGHPEEGVAFRQEVQEGERTKDLNKRAMAQELGVFDMDRLVRLSALWLAGTSVLTLFIATLLFGGLCKGLSYTGRIRESLPLHTGVAAGLLLVLGSGILGGLAGLTMRIAPALSALFWFGSMVATCTGLWRLFWRVPEGQQRVVVGAALATIVATVAFCALLVLPGLGAMRNGMDIAGLIQSTQTDVEASAATHARTTQTLGTLASLVGGTALLPVLSWVGIAWVSRRKQLPVSVGIVRFFPQAALPLALVMVLIYGGLTWATATQEEQHQKELHLLVQHEGRYNAQLLGERW